MTCPSIGLKRGLVRDEKQLYNAYTIQLTIMFKQGKPYFIFSLSTMFSITYRIFVGPGIWIFSVLSEEELVQSVQRFGQQ